MSSGIPNFGYSQYNNQNISSNHSASLSPGSSTTSNSSLIRSVAPSLECRLNSPLPMSSSSALPRALGSPSEETTAPLFGSSETSEGSAARLAALNLAAAGSSIYTGASYPSTDNNPYPSISMDNSFYSSLSNPYNSMKDGGAAAAEMNAAAAAAWSSALPPTACYYSYDHPTLAAYGYGGGYDLAARRKNATRESTATLKAWLNEHKKNPYPTKGEKIMLAIITKMTLTQVSTWFANARRRLKKENKMTWEPKNKLDDEDVELSDDDDEKFSSKDDDDDKLNQTHLTGRSHLQSLSDDKSGIPIPPSKPKIWSLADTAVCKTPPPANSGHHGSLVSHHFPPWSGNLYRPNPLTAASAAFRTLGLSRTHPEFLSGLGGGGGKCELQADTPPHTPPNVKSSSSGNFHYIQNPGFGH